MEQPQTGISGLNKRVKITMMVVMDLCSNNIQTTAVCVQRSLQIPISRPYENKYMSIIGVN